jgi:predicted O-methyltransferase YrrM
LKASTIFESVDSFISGRFSKDDAALKGVQKSLQVAGVRNISVSSSQGKFLHVLAHLCRASRILEIGTLGGYSTIWMARALPSDGVLFSIENNEKHAELARRNVDRAGLSRLVEIRVGDAQAVLKELEQKKVAPFDMVFIDADKVSYDKYFRHALKLTRKGSLIVADNVIRQGKILQAGINDENVLGARRFLQALARSKRVTAAIVQTVGAKGHDGMAIAVVEEPGA